MTLTQAIIQTSTWTLLGTLDFQMISDWLKSGNDGSSINQLIYDFQKSTFGEI